MTPSAPPNITPGDAGHNRETSRASPVPTRAELQALEARVLVAGGPTKADLGIVEVGGTALVVKDFARKA